MCDLSLREDVHRYREENGVKILATLRNMVIKALRLDEICTITEAIAALAHVIYQYRQSAAVDQAAPDDLISFLKTIPVGVSLLRSS